MNKVLEILQMRVESWRASEGVWGYYALSTRWFVAQFSFQPPMPRRAVDISFARRR